MHSVTDAVKNFLQPTNKPRCNLYKSGLPPKSKNQKTTGLILAGGGVVLEIAGVIAYQYGNASILLFGTGLLSQVVSIPFLISARVNKKRAKHASLSLGLENIPTTQLARIPFRSTPEIALRIIYK